MAQKTVWVVIYSVGLIPTDAYVFATRKQAEFQAAFLDRETEENNRVGAEVRILEAYAGPAVG